MSVPFWLSLILLVYPLAGYPLILGAARPFARTSLPADSAYTPGVSVLLSVYNEEDVIAHKIRNFLDLDYPEDKLELLIVSDASEDGTEAAITPFMSERVRLLRQEQRGGKTKALNRAVEEARGNILVFTDADSMLKPESLGLLVSPFHHADVGLVSARTVYIDDQGRETAGSLYRRYEEWLKEREGSLYGIAGADGAFYAMRRELYSPLPPEQINDLVHPIQVILQGKRALACPKALVFEGGAGAEGQAEFARQTRILAQSWLIFLRFAPTLARNRRWGYLWQFISHKVLRWLSAPFLATAAVTALFLPVNPGLFFFAGLFALIGGGVLGARGKGGFFGRMTWLYGLQGMAAINGLYRLCRGEKYATWKPRAS